jgi:hypothetical protein
MWSLSLKTIRKQLYIVKKYDVLYTKSDIALSVIILLLIQNWFYSFSYPQLFGCKILI